MGYVAGGVAGLQLASVAGAVTLVWPATGIAVAALVLGGRVMAAPVWLGALTVNLAIGGSPLTALVIASGNTLEAVVAATLLARAGFQGDFESRREVAHYVVSAGLLAPVVAALIGSSALLLAGTIEAVNWLPTAGVWWAGDATGALIVGPLVLTWARPANRGPRVAATVCALLCLTAVLATATLGGPLQGAAGPFSPVPLWLFMTNTAVLSLLLTALNVERGSAELANHMSEARFALAFEHAPIGMAMITQEGRVLDANPQIARMLVSEPARLRGLPVTTWLSEAELDTARRAIEAGPYEPPTLIHVTDEAGEVREWNVRLSRVPLGEREQALLLQAEDVTESRVNSATLKVLNEQLVHAQRMDSVGNLAGGIAHDFNNLLQAIGANLELAQHPNASPAMRAKVLDNAGDSVRRAAALTSRLLAFSHRSPVQRVPVDLNQTLTRAREMLARLLPENITLEVHCDDEPALALVDETQLDQVLMNLCVNARDAMPEGGRIELRVEVDGPWIVVTSTDQGPGVPPELRQRVFEPFFTTKARGQGTGFGLAVVFGIVRAHEGDIHIEDGPEGGARFVIRLPRTQERQAAPERPSKPDASTPLTVLLAEDDLAVRHVLREMLTAEGHTVVEACDGVQAIERFEEQGDKIDVLLFDVRMPHMKGPVAMQRILAQRRDLPAILMSGYSGDDLADVDPALADVPLLPKPFERADLLLALQRVMRARAPLARGRAGAKSVASSTPRAGADAL